MSSSETRELELVGKVEMRIALAKDDKLESMLKIYLAPLLLKLGSDYQSVRNKVSRHLLIIQSYETNTERPKVVSTCQHIKIRLVGNQ